MSDILIIFSMRGVSVTLIRKLFKPSMQKSATIFDIFQKKFFMG